MLLLHVARYRGWARKSMWMGWSCRSSSFISVHVEMNEMWQIQHRRCSQGCKLFFSVASSLLRSFLLAPAVMSTGTSVQISYFKFPNTSEIMLLFKPTPPPPHFLSYPTVLEHDYCKNKPEIICRLGEQTVKVCPRFQWSDPIEWI